MDPSAVSWMDRTTVWPYVLLFGVVLLILGAVVMASESLRGSVLNLEGSIVFMLALELAVFYYTGMLQSTMYAVEPYFVLIVLVATLFFPCAKFLFYSLMEIVEKLDFLTDLVENFTKFAMMDFSAIEDKMGIKHQTAGGR